MLHNISKFFSDNPWLNIIFLLLAISSIILTLIFYFKSKKEKRPTYSKKTSNVIQRNVIKSNKLEVKYNDSTIENLSMTEVAFWNSGRETIRGSDIAPHDPLIIKSKDKIILYDFEILFQDKVNNFQIQKSNENQLKILFDFIDFNQGVKLKIYHSGNKSSEVEIIGTIIGAKYGLKAGVKKQMLMNKMDWVTVPINDLVNSKYKVFKLFGYLLGILMAPLLVALALVILPLDQLYEIIHNSHPKEFLLHD